ncbi:TonB-dependent receptor [Qipengyuania qiaonensis]|uniref:TonB-dependent receptor n=1 Tax=Qipengyuania qiaonensis TaxID=2867240 RepID=A0ABS7J8T0_9SPHN|nr:TonB-dependent receptor [Qipengyuania qiaonensis]MBX7483742.1 TonB-dependent receptor [Qipengyuania qiaonensis]
MIFSHKNRSAVARRLALALVQGCATGALAIGIAAPAHAQESNASLRGQITGGATQVAAVREDTGVRRSVAIDANGRYNFASLAAGAYRLEVTTPDGVLSTDTFQLSVAQNAVLNFDVGELAAPAEDGAEDSPEEAPADGDVILVTGDRIRTLEGGEVGINISQRLIEQIPQTNRNFLAFADLAPGVQFIDNFGGDRRLQGGAQNGNSVNVFIDGVSQKDYVLRGGITGQDSTQGNPFPQAAIGEYRVISSNYKAEFDQVSSVAVTAITKSGTNEFHGSGFIDFTNEKLRAARPIEIFGTNPLGKTESRDLQYGGTLGGPIIRDKLFFFGTYEGKEIVTPRDVTPGLDLAPSDFPSQYQGEFGSRSEIFNENLYFGKLDFTPNSADVFQVSLKYRDEDGEDFSSGNAAYSTRTVTSVKEWRGLARWEHTSDNFINDFKVTYEDVTWNPRPFLLEPRNVFRAVIFEDDTRREDTILQTGGGRSFQDKGQDGWQISNDFTWTGFDRHTIKAGVKAKWVTLNSTEQNSFNPQYTFNTSYNPDDPDNLNSGPFNDQIPYELNFSSVAPGTDITLNSKTFQFGIYIQDDWDVTDRLTLNLGVRWDFERTPDFLNYVHDPARVAAVQPDNYPNLVNANYDINDFISTGTEREVFYGAIQPRIGFSYWLDPDGQFVLFGGYGRSYDRNQFDFVQQELVQGAAFGRTFQFQNAGDPRGECTASPTCVPFDPIYLTEAGRQQLIDGAPPGAGGELRFIDNDLKLPYSDQFSLGVRSTFDLINLEVGYSHIASRDGFGYLLGNRRPDGSFFPDEGNAQSPFGFPPSPYGAILIGTNGINTDADSAYLKFGKRYTPQSPWSIDATYTFTLAEENRRFGEFFSLDFPSFDDYPVIRSRGVRKHRFVMAGTVDLPLNFTLGSKFQIASPAYEQAFISVDGDPDSRDIVAVERDSNGDLWGFRQFDLSLTKYFDIGLINDDTRIWVRADVLNVFNDRNYNGFNAVTGERDFNNLSTDGFPRTLKVSAGFEF